MSFIYTLVSSSKGNATYVGDNTSGIMIDAGVGIRNFANHFKSIDVDISAIKGIFITHEHSDHTNGLKKIVQKYNIPVFGSKQTLIALLNKQTLTYDMDIFEVEEELTIAGYRVKPIKTPHDSVDSQCYNIFTKDDKKVSVFTDIGHVTDSVHNAMLGSDVVMIESNYEKRMLEIGSYPQFLKKRILGNNGHLSNDDCADEIIKLYRSGVKKFVLGHLSQENNMPHLAYSNVVLKMSELGLSVDKDYLLFVAPRVNEGIMINV